MSATGHNAKPQIRVTEPATVTACAHGCPRVLAMCPGSEPAMKNIASALAMRTRRTIQAKMSSMFLDRCPLPARTTYDPQKNRLPLRADPERAGRNSKTLAPLALTAAPSTLACRLTAHHVLHSAD